MGRWLSVLAVAWSLSGHAQRGPCGFVREESGGLVRWHTPYGMLRNFGGEGRIDLVKRVPVGSSPEHVLMLSIAGETLETGRKGVIVEFTDGQRLSWPEAGVSGVASRLTQNWVYSASVRLDETQIRQLQASPIRAFYLIDFQAKVPARYARNVQEFTGCLDRLQ